MFKFDLGRGGGAVLLSGLQCTGLAGATGKCHLQTAGFPEVIAMHSSSDPLPQRPGIDIF